MQTVSLARGTSDKQIRGAPIAKPGKEHLNDAKSHDLPNDPLYPKEWYIVSVYNSQLTRSFRNAFSKCREIFVKTATVVYRPTQTVTVDTSKNFQGRCLLMLFSELENYVPMQERHPQHWFSLTEFCLFLFLN